ncbi:MAG: 3-oxoacyl-ACP synthase, 3-oxoacyl-[acyl-carrier-protein] synthase III [Deltaproteobacteria bacterium CSP1-8]|nr:MAG: 3-oxoacyl-ACP synthase, 3-oxoacyl-[acyl-carrier-protein] synthase III [Deltaproteobacteria bacterium CSP1-8]
MIGLGMYAPPKTLTNDELEKMVDTSDSWIMERTGIKLRRIAEPRTACSDLCLEASKRALADAGISPSEIDIIVVGTCTPDMPLPSTACFLQMKLGAGRAYALDLNAACSGFLYSLSAADAMIRAGRGKKALVVGGEILSTVTDYTDRNTCILFGDGAGAVVLSECPDGEGVLSCHLHSDGNLWELIYAPGGGTVHPYGPEVAENRMHAIRMAGNETFKQAVTRMVEVSLEALQHNRVDISDVALFLPHQANMRIINAVGKRLGISEGRVFVNLERYGNTSAASVPIALAEAREQGRFAKGDLLLLASFGAGLTWGSALVRM